MSNNKFSFSSAGTGTIARTAVLILALANQIFAACGKPMIPVEDEDLSALITTGITVGAAVAAWWKNNSVTMHAQTADEYLKSLKRGEPARTKADATICN